MFTQINLDPYQLLFTEDKRTGALFNASPHVYSPHRIKLDDDLRLIRKGAQLEIPRQPLWQEKGWRQETDRRQCTGYFVAYGRKFRGLIVQPYPDCYNAFIWHPPLEELGRNTSHKPCFSANGERGRYQIHFRTMPSSLDHAITNIERVLAEAYGRSSR